MRTFNLSRSILASICTVALLVYLALFPPSRYRSIRADIAHSTKIQLLSPPDHIEKFNKPKGFKIVALIFYGRRDRVSILDCYLKRNLVHHGGFLDEVIFLQRTAVQEDIDWLHTTVSNTPGYTIANYTEERGGDYSHSWDLCEPGTMYIKIDDDIVFIEDTAIPAIVNTKLSNPHSLLVSANAVNQPALAWTHHHLGVVKPYLPELTPIPGPNPRPTYDWRASDLPDWQGPLSFIVPNDFSPPFPYHRWLPARHLNNTDDTPISTATYTLDGTGWSSWTVAAQQHYSFLEHLEKGELWRYRFTMWDYHYDRLSTNFMCIWGDDIIAIKDGMGEDDEGYMTTVATRKLGRHALMDGRGLAVHFSFGAQEGMAGTDVLERYRAYAEENICQR